MCRARRIRTSSIIHHGVTRKRRPDVSPEPSICGVFVLTSICGGRHMSDTSTASALDRIEQQQFQAMTTSPHPSVVDGFAVGHGLSDRPVPRHPEDSQTGHAEESRSKARRDCSRPRYAECKPVRLGASRRAVIRQRRQPSGTTEPADAPPGPAHLVPELRRRGSYSAKFGPHSCECANHVRALHRLITLIINGRERASTRRSPLRPMCKSLGSRLPTHGALQLEVDLRFERPRSSTGKDRANLCVPRCRLATKTNRTADRIRCSRAGLHVAGGR